MAVQQGDIISAIATAPGEGGIGIIRISGEGAIGLADLIFRAASGRRVADYKGHSSIFGRVYQENGILLDEAICLVMKAPNSYTCEDVVELQCHGGATVLRELLALTYRMGARPAEPGEFTKRAFLNGRIDLSQAQAVMDVINAKTAASLRLAAGNLLGRFSGKIKEIRHSLLELIAHLEASIDFPEDDIEDVVTDEAGERLGKIKAELDDIIKASNTGIILRNGLKTAIVGRPNAGKSSLMNLLAGQERSIVTNIPGTTRDSIEESVSVGGVPLVLTDTAGIRETEDEVEKIGVGRAIRQLESASLILAVFDRSQELNSEDLALIERLKSRGTDGSRIIAILNKTDKGITITSEEFKKLLPLADIIEFSAADGQGLPELEKAIISMAYGGIKENESDMGVGDLRQVELLRRASELIGEAIGTVENGMSEDFIVIDIRSAWEKLGEITGDTLGEDIIDQIFSQFCIGK